MQNILTASQGTNSHAETLGRLKSSPLHPSGKKRWCLLLLGTHTQTHTPHKRTKTAATLSPFISFNLGCKKIPGQVTSTSLSEHQSHRLIWGWPQQHSGPQVGPARPAAALALAKRVRGESKGAGTHTGVFGGGHKVPAAAEGGACGLPSPSPQLGQRSVHVLAGASPRLSDRAVTVV